MIWKDASFSAELDAASTFAGKQSSMHASIEAKKSYPAASHPPILWQAPSTH